MGIIEIERKFSVRHLPDGLNNCPQQHIMQGYASIDQDGKEVRLRKNNDSYYLTIKAGSGLLRSEHEVELSAEQFQEL